MMNWSCRRIDATTFAELHRLADGDTGALDLMPATVPDSLADSEREFVNTDGTGRELELSLQDRIARAWIDGGYGRRPVPADGIPVPSSGKLGDAGFADLVLVDTERDRTLVVVEIKRVARPGTATEGVRQVLRYKRWLVRHAPGWTVIPSLVALHISPTVLQQARAEGIECWEFDPDEEAFYEPGS
jgi:hypothetical protein